ncbi:hypothetical protein [Nocardia sp. NBC_01327]|uniref:hypothetical protein n=1 Tax=Nocardia sp. NBC_01327 TaxID=2903593 RepID=UPI002E11B803|nr:hypothetical protein OG326_34385 [Nocardia sp. NBC_01327]
MKLVELKNERKRIEAQLADVSERLGIGVSVLQHALDLIAAPYALYRDANSTVRRHHLNETFYRRFYIDDLDNAMAPQVTDEMIPVFSDVHRVARSCRSAQTPRSKRVDKPRNEPPFGGSNKALWVGTEGFEPPTAGV